MQYRQIRIWQGLSGLAASVRPRVRWMMKPRRIAVALAATTAATVAQLSYLKATYVPLRPPSQSATSGLETWEGNKENGHDKSRPKKRVLIIGDSLVVGIGCEKEAVMAPILCKRLAELLEADIAWSTHGINGGDVRTIYRDIVDRLNDWRHHQEPQLLRALSRLVPDRLTADFPRAPSPAWCPTA
mmetsp:Transcript_14266/g.38955  ORF Transcript_14266/g.38955 Transcript_14266/m.38955 type:complete len:186 (+) Transcript_14266:99-656(+)